MIQYCQHVTQEIVRVVLLCRQRTPPASPLCLSTPCQPPTPSIPPLSLTTHIPLQRQLRPSGILDHDVAHSGTFAQCNTTQHSASMTPNTPPADACDTCQTAVDLTQCVSPPQSRQHHAQKHPIEQIDAAAFTAGTAQSSSQAATEMPAVRAVCLRHDAEQAEGDSLGSRQTQATDLSREAAVKQVAGRSKEATLMTQSTEPGSNAMRLSTPTQHRQLSRQAESEANAAEPIHASLAQENKRQAGRRGRGGRAGRGEGSARAQAFMQAAAGVATLDSARFGFFKLPASR